MSKQKVNASIDKSVFDGLVSFSKIELRSFSQSMEILLREILVIKGFIKK